MSIIDSRKLIQINVIRAYLPLCTMGHVTAADRPYKNPPQDYNPEHTPRVLINICLGLANLATAFYTVEGSRFSVAFLFELSCQAFLFLLT